jgi:DNA-directed RNA polymerase subunit D
MKLELLHQKDNIMAFHVDGVNPAYLNTLRRLMMTEVPVMAIETVQFGKNNSILYDEVVSHRLGLIPLTTDLKGYNMKEERGSEGNPSNEVTLTLKVGKVKGEHIVTAGEMQSSDPKIKAVHADMPIVKLIDGQDMEFIAKAELGTGKEHMKWSPCLAYYRQYPHITITKQPKNVKNVMEQYPGVFELKGDKLQVAPNGGYHLPDAELDMEDGEAHVEHKGDFIFVVESWGQLPPTAIVEEAIRLYDEQLATFAKSL